MPTTAALAWGLGLAAILQAPAAVEPEHAANAVYRELLEGGLTLGETPVPFAAPVVGDGLSADSARAALRKIAGSASKADDMLAKSVTAPFIIKVRDVTTKGPTLIRAADLWFVIHGDLDAIDPADVSRKAGKPEATEAGNMRFEARRVPPDALKARDLDPPAENEWYAHMSGRLLDRIGFEETDRVMATKSPGSLVIASRVSDPFHADGPASNRWHKLFKNAAGQPTAPGPPRPYPGGGGYVKISRLPAPPGALLVESHFAFAEPREWFEGAPTLRSKIGLAAQDQIRALRRELAKGNPKPDDAAK